MNKRTFYIGSTILGIGLIYLILKKRIVKNFTPTKNSTDNSTKDLKSILFVGDSISEITHNGSSIKFTYPNLIKNKLQSKGIKVDVLAVRGKTTSWMLSNLIKKLKNNNYYRIYIYGGINDIFNGITKNQALSNIQQMVDLINSKGAEAYVIVGYDARIFMDENRFKPTKYLDKINFIKAKNKYIEFQNDIPNKIKNATIVPKFNIPSKNSADGTHPTGTGHQMIANSLLEGI